MEKKNIIGSWKIDTPTERLTDRSFARCLTVMTFDEEGNCKRECISYKFVQETDGAVVKYIIPVTLSGTYDLNGDVVTMKDFTISLGNPDVTVDVSKCKKKEDQEYYNSETAKKLMLTGLRINVAEVMRNRGNECINRNNGYPVCHLRVENNKLYQKWDGYNGEEVMDKAEELNYQIVSGPMSGEEATNIPQVYMIKAFLNADLEYIQKLYFILPCENSKNDKEDSFKFYPMHVGDKLYIPAFTDPDKFRQSELTDGKTGYKHAQLQEIHQILEATQCHALCINPINGSAVLSLQKEWIEAMLDGRWGGMDENGQIIIKEKANCE